MLLKIATDFSVTPGGRYRKDGAYSGELFRERFLIPRYNKCLLNEETLTIDFDGSYGYSTGFLEEAFGGIIRKGYSYLEVIKTINFISFEEPRIIEDILVYMIEEERRKEKNEGNIKRRKIK